MRKSVSLATTLAQKDRWPLNPSPMCGAPPILPESEGENPSGLGFKQIALWRIP
jgi:hypothetical protein